MEESRGRGDVVVADGRGNREKAVEVFAVHVGRKRQRLLRLRLERGIEKIESHQ